MGRLSLTFPGELQGWVRAQASEALRFATSACTRTQPCSMGKGPLSTSSWSQGRPGACWGDVAKRSASEPRQEPGLP